MPIKPLSFKGDKKPSSKKRKHTHTSDQTFSTFHQTPTPQTDIPQEEDDSWTNPTAPLDLSGPLLIVLPTKPPTCLASDAHGSVFASPLENIIDENPDTAEPHDVRQVWIVSGVAGVRTTGKDLDKEKDRPREINLRASQGGYLSCDVNGVLGARREARGREEGWFVELADPNDNGDEDEGVRGKMKWRLRGAARPVSTKSTSTSTAMTSPKKDEGDDIQKSDEGPYLGATPSTSASSTSSSTTTLIPSASSNPNSNSKTTLTLSISGRNQSTSSTTALTLRMQTRFLPLTSTHPANVLATKQRENKVSRAELERAVGRKLEDIEVRTLKRAKRDGTYHESVLDLRAKGKHDKFA